MKRRSQKILVVLLALFLCLTSFAQTFVFAEKETKATEAAVGEESTKESQEEESEKIRLTFGEDGKFKIMMMSDFQDYISDEKPEVNPKSTELMDKAIKQENPDLVVMVGDMIGGNMNEEQLPDYIRQMVAPLEENKVPWLVTFGNHDEDAVDALEAGWNKIVQLDYYRSFEYNINRPSMSGVEGFETNQKNTFAVGDMYTLIYDETGETPLYNIWALDSNRYDWSETGFGGYDWFKFGQVAWYYNTSVALEEEYGKLNSLMFFHIPLPEFKAFTMDTRCIIEGHRTEDEYPSKMNSGLFAAAFERGDVKGMFSGHAHLNDYVGNYFGIFLGFDANVGFETYGFDYYKQLNISNNELRGVRVLELDVADLESFETYMVYAKDLGIELD